MKFYILPFNIYLGHQPPIAQDHHYMSSSFDRQSINKYAER